MLRAAATFLVHPAHANLKPFGQLFGRQDVLRIEGGCRIHLQLRCNVAPKAMIPNARNLTSRSVIGCVKLPEGLPTLQIQEFVCGCDDARDHIRVNGEFVLTCFRTQEVTNDSFCQGTFSVKALSDERHDFLE